MSDQIHILMRRLVLRGKQSIAIPVMPYSTLDLAKERMRHDDQTLKLILGTGHIAVAAQGQQVIAGAPRMKDYGPLMSFLANELGIEGFEQYIQSAPVKASNIEVVPGGIINKH